MPKGNRRTIVYGLIIVLILGLLYLGTQSKEGFVVPYNVDIQGKKNFNLDISFKDLKREFGNGMLNSIQFFGLDKEKQTLTIPANEDWSSSNARIQIQIKRADSNNFITLHSEKGLSLRSESQKKKIREDAKTTKTYILPIDLSKFADEDILRIVNPTGSLLREGNKTFSGTSSSFLYNEDSDFVSDKNKTNLRIQFS